MGYPGSLPGAECIFYYAVYFRQNGLIGQPRKTLLYAGFFLNARLPDQIKVLMVLVLH